MNEQQVKEFINIIVGNLKQHNIHGAHIPVEFTPELADGDDAGNLSRQLHAIIQHGRECGLRFHGMTPSIKPSSFRLVFNDQA